MTQTERTEYLIRKLLEEQPLYRGMDIPVGEDARKRLLRALFNVRPPKPASEEFLTVQNEYLQEELRRKGISDIDGLQPVAPDIYLWQGDITTLKCDAIVNAANSQMLGCFFPNHGCIDNAIHTFAGVQLRLECAELTGGRQEQTGQALITGAYNLPCKYVLHTVGPIVSGGLTSRHERLLASCYRSCLALAEQKGLQSVAFCCISTGEFHFPNARAAQIAVQTVKEHKKETGSKIKVVFNVFKDFDRQIYAGLLG